MNSRDGRLAYWTGGVDAGSTFVCTLALDETSGIDDIYNDPDSIRYTITFREYVSLPTALCREYIYATKGIKDKVYID